MRSTPFTVALLIALAIVTLWWQLSEKRARKSDAELAEVRQRASAIEAQGSMWNRAFIDLESGTEAFLPRFVRDSARADHPGKVQPSPFAERSVELRSRLRYDLVRHPELVPFPAVHGGTMFFDTSSVFLLPDRWIYADFEDGHIAGRGIFEYRIQGDRVVWKRIAAQLD